MPAADPQTLASVPPRPDRLPPPPVLEVPRNRFTQPTLKRLARLPAQLAPDFGSVHGITPVVARPVGDEGDQLLMRPMRRCRQHLVEQCANRSDDLEIGPLGIAADIIALPDRRFGQDGVEGAG